MDLKNEEDCIKLVPRQYAREILRTSPLTFMEQSTIEEIKEGIEKYIQEYGLQIIALDGHNICHSFSLFKKNNIFCNSVIIFIAISLYQ